MILGEIVGDIVVLVLGEVVFVVLYFYKRDEIKED